MTPTPVPDGVRRLDHINYLAANVEQASDFLIDVLGARPTEQIRLDNGKIAARWQTFTQKSYDLVYTEDWTGSTGRLHHLAFATDTREDILRAADLLGRRYGPVRRRLRTLARRLPTGCGPCGVRLRRLRGDGLVRRCDDGAGNRHDQTAAARQLSLAEGRAGRLHRRLRLLEGQTVLPTALSMKGLADTALW